MLQANLVDGDSGPRNADTPYRSNQLESHQRLVFTRGVSRVTLESFRGSGEVLETDFEGSEPPRVTRTPREIRIGYHGSFWSHAYDVFLGGPLELPHSTLRLNERAVWEIRCDGGASDLDAHLEDVSLASFSVRGGASHVSLALGRPSGVVPIRIRGGLSRFSLVRPRGVGVRLSVRGGIGSLTFDAMHFDSIGGGLILPSRAGADADDRYELEIGGGVSDLLIA